MEHVSRKVEEWCHSGAVADIILHGFQRVPRPCEDIETAGNCDYLTIIYINSKGGSVPLSHPLLWVARLVLSRSLSMQSLSSLSSTVSEARRSLSRSCAGIPLGSWIHNCTRSDQSRGPSI